MMGTTSSGTLIVLFGMYVFYVHTPVMSGGVHRIPGRSLVAPEVFGESADAVNYPWRVQVDDAAPASTNQAPQNQPTHQNPEPRAAGRRDRDTRC